MILLKCSGVDVDTKIFSVFSSVQFGGGTGPELSTFDGCRSAVGGTTTTTATSVEGTTTIATAATLQSSISASAASRIHGDTDDVDTIVTSEVAMTTHTVPPPHTEITQYISSKRRLIVIEHSHVYSID